jgi:hypothetical protein
MDYDSVHLQKELKQCVAELDTSLLFIPPRLMDEFQPFDRFVFEFLKNNCCRIYRVQMTELGVMSKQPAAGFLVWTWEGVNSEVIDEA